MADDETEGERAAEASGEDARGEEAEPAPRPVKKAGKSGKAKRRKAAPQAEKAEAIAIADVSPAAKAVTSPAQVRDARRALMGGATLGVAGLALVGIGPSEAGMALSLTGLLILIFGIHTFGRLGAEQVS